jgi:hypothetical protein
MAVIDGMRPFTPESVEGFLEAREEDRLREGTRRPREETRNPEIEAAVLNVVGDGWLSSDEVAELLPDHDAEQVRHAVHELLCDWMIDFQGGRVRRYTVENKVETCRWMLEGRNAWDESMA